MLPLLIVSVIICYFTIMTQGGSSKINKINCVNHANMSTKGKTACAEVENALMIHL